MSRDQRKSGRAVSFGASPDALRQASAGALGDSSLQKRAIAFTPDANGDLGHLDAVESIVNVNGHASFDIPHTLGRRPSYVMLGHYENPATPGTIIAFAPTSRESWTDSTVAGSINVIAGSSNGLVCHFIVM